MIETSILTRPRRFRGSHINKMIERSSQQIKVLIDTYEFVDNGSYYEDKKTQLVDYIRGIAATKKNTLSSDNKGNFIRGHIVVYSIDYLHYCENPKTNIHFEIITDEKNQKINRYKITSVENWGSYYIYHAHLAY